jgi:hypothetical protein
MRANVTNRRIFAIATLFWVALAWVLAEFVFLPRSFGVPRATALFGLMANTTKVDDTEINALGFTGDVPGEIKQPSEKRILLLGGSAMFNRRLAVRLKTALQARSVHPVVVLDAALRSHTSRASVIKYRYLAKYRFDYVVINEGNIGKVLVHMVSY